MYLENSEQTKACGEGESSAEAMLAEQCQVPKLSEAAELASSSKGSTQLGVKVLMEYTEQTVVSRELLQHDNSSGECMEHCNMKRDYTDETEQCVYCNGHAEGLEQYPTSDGFLKSRHDECETAGLSQPSDECVQHCECFKPCKSSEHCANHSLASKCSPCCEHCPEHLQFFQQCKLSDPQSFESEPENLTENCENSVQSEIFNITPECTDHLDLLQQYEHTDQQVELNTSLDCEPCDTAGFTLSMDLLDCDTEICKNDKIHSQIECIDGDDDSHQLEQMDESCEMQDSDGDLSEDINPSTITPLYVEDSKHESCERELCEKQLTEENLEQGSELDPSTDHCKMDKNDHFEIRLNKTEICVNTQHCSEDKATDCSTFCNEEDCSSDCSSIETKSFKTCPDGSIPSEPYSDSSEESEKGGQGDSSDEQTQWESFEEDEEILQQTNIEESIADQKKTPTLNMVIEDYFDLFDRADYFGHAQRQPYISCFDGGDIHDRLSLEVLQAEEQKCAKNAYKNEENSKEVTAQDVCFVEEFPGKDASDEDTAETSDTSFGSSETEKQPEEDVESESDLVDDEVGVNDSVSEVCEAEEDDGQSYVSDELNEGAADEETHPRSSGAEDSMCAPCAEDIYVEGDAYEDDIFDNMNDEWHGSISTTEHLLKTDGTDVEEPDIEALGNFYTFEDVFIACSETEPYWVLGNKEEVVCESGIEDYYAYQIESIQSSPHQSLNAFLVNPQSSGSCPAESKGVRFGITEVIELGETLAHCSTEQDSDSECCLDDVSRETRLPHGIIHSVSENDRIDPRTEDSEEEASDDESSEPCECEYCIPPLEQVPAKALLPQIQSNDAGKICVVIDLDETLVHSSFKPLNNADFTIPVEIDGTIHQVYVLKRPHVDEFLKRMGELFECVLFTASLSKYADPVSDLLDPWGAFTTRLFRESCVFHKGNYVKDLSHLGRDLNRVIIIDNSPASYIFHPDNAVPVASWFDDMSDTELLDLLPFFERLSKVNDIYELLQQQQSTST